MALCCITFRFIEKIYYMGQAQIIVLYEIQSTQSTLKVQKNKKSLDIDPFLEKNHVHTYACMHV